MCFMCNGQPRSMIDRRSLFRGLGATALLGLAPVLAAKDAEAQMFWQMPIPQTQRLNLGPGPDGHQPVPEFITQPGLLGGFAGMARPEPGIGTVVYYDSGWIQQSGGIGSPFFRFIRAHEYGHVRQSHRAANPAQYFGNELAADCFAARICRTRNDMIAVQAGAQMYQQVLPPFDAPAMPGWQRRVQNLQACGA